MERRRRTTTTSSFGAGARESHDATPFYERFHAPDLSDDDTVLPPEPVPEPFLHGDARHMDAVADGSVALVVTSPPYFAGKQYELEVERKGIPSSYLEYLELLRDVFAECVRKLEPGGRIAVNVANLGRKPYRSLSADIVGILQGDLGLLLRGELIWRKGEGASGSVAWGSFRSASNPVLRDVTERVVIASKGRFDRARSAKQRAAAGLPHESTLMTEDFMAMTLDVWEIRPQSARQVGHPAPFPVELPERLIRLYTYRDDLVLDPFMGSGSSLVAAANLERRFVGYDLDPDYVDLARRRVATEVSPEDAEEPETLRADAVREGRSAESIAGEVLEEAGFTVAATDRRVPGTGVTVSFAATDGEGVEWLFDVPGPFVSRRGGLEVAAVVWGALGRAAAVAGRHPGMPLVLLTTSLPRSGGPVAAALRAPGPRTLFDVVDLFSEDARDRLRRYAKGGVREPIQGFWSPADLGGT